MKIGIITYAFHTSTMPLAKHLAELGNDVDLLCLTGSRSSDLFTIDLSHYNSSNGFIPKNKFEGIINKNILTYLKILNDFNIFLYSKRRRNLYIDCLFQVFSLSRFLNSKKYDVIHFIGQNELYSLLYRLLNPPKIFTFHEIEGPTVNGDLQKFPLVNLISRKKNSVIFHSSNIKEKYLQNYVTRNRGIYVIKFGLFETYRLFPDQTKEEPKTVLYYGIIQPYKGIEYLVAAFKLVKKDIPDIKLIIAGRGSIYFDVSTLKDDGIELINRTISEEELVHLNNRATLVVCPYTSSSQSGIPVTSFVFNKPIIASNVQGLSEYVIDGFNGVLVPPCDSLSLACEIKKLIVDEKLRKTIKRNISQMNNKSQTTWTSIAEQTINVYLAEIQNSIATNSK